MKISEQSHPYESGQALLEAVVAFSILFLSFFLVIEVVRLVAYKTLLQTITSATARQIAYTQLDLINRDLLSDGKSKNKNFEDDVSNKISKDLNSMESALLSFDHKKNQDRGVLYLTRPDLDISILFVNQKKPESTQQPGVYLKVNSCLPVLFSSYFQNISKDKSTEIGRKVKNLNQNRTCLGHFSNSKFTPLYWFRVRASSYSSWPAASEIYLKGYAFPKDIYGLENEYRQDVLRGVAGLNLAKFFLGDKNNASMQYK